jgi:hypothetical protein
VATLAIFQQLGIAACRFVRPYVAFGTRLDTTDSSAFQPSVINFEIGLLGLQARYKWLAGKSGCMVLELQLKTEAKASMRSSERHKINRLLFRNLQPQAQTISSNLITQKNFLHHV